MDSGLAPTEPRIGHLFCDLAGNGTSIDLRAFQRSAVMSLYWTAGGMVSTPADLLTSSRALFGTTRVLSEDRRDRFTVLDDYGYGLASNEFCPCETDASGGTTFSGRGHDGYFPGFRTILGCWLDADVAIVLYVNQAPISNDTCSRGGISPARAQNRLRPR